MENDLSGSSICNPDQGELLKSAKAKMGEVREENERLKKLLAQVMVDYKSLENHISSMARDTREKNSSINHKNDNREDLELVSLTLGNSTSNKEYYGDTKKDFVNGNDWISKRRKVGTGGLELGLDSSDSIQKSTLNNEEAKEEENIETQSTSRGDLKSKEKTSPKELDEESLQQPQVKKTRVCLRSRCDTTTMNDGCQWRKYGQKIAKGNPCPRAYYRCTASPTCPVRKQVQRCVDDMTILITTYEGTHNHPLPMSATAIATATSAAAAMLKTGSLTSQQPPFVGPTTNHLHNSTNLINPFITNNPRLSIPNPSMISTSSHSHPTITLDLTAPNTSPFNNWLPSSSSSRNTPGFLSFSSPASYSTSLNFNYGTLFPNNNTMNNNRNIYQNNPSNPQTSMNETIAAMATKVIASNPNFQSVLAAAISSYVGNNNKPINNINDQKKSLSPPRINAQLSEGSSSLMLFPTSLPLPVSKNSASAAVNSRDHIS